MKRLLALLLAGLMLIGFGVGGSAETPEELEAEEIVSQETQEPEAEEVVPQATQAELEAEGRALLVQTMEDLRGDYTIQDPDRYHPKRKWIHSGDVYVRTIEDRFYRYDISTETAFTVFPLLDFYQKRSEFQDDYLSLLEPKAVPADAPISVTVDGEKLKVLFDGLTYTYRSGELIQISKIRYAADTTLMQKGADLSAYSIAGMMDGTTQEGLEAVGRVLLKQTMEDFREDYTCRYYPWPEVVHSGGNYAFLLKDGTHELHLNGQIYRVYPDRKVYHKSASASEAYQLQYYTPREITEATPITVELGPYGIHVSLDDLDDFSYYYRYDTGALDYFRKEVDLSLLSLDGLSETSALKVRLWDFSDRYWRVFQSSFADVFSLSSLFDEFFGVPLYPIYLFTLFGCLLISPVMLILRLFL